MKKRWAILTELIKDYPAPRGAEIGVKTGRTSFFMLRANPKLKMIGVDPWAPQPGFNGPQDWADWDHERNYRAALEVKSHFPGRFTIYRAFSKEAASLIPEDSLDFVFLDGDHSEHGTYEAIKDWFPKIRMGGLVTGHDIKWESVRAAVEHAFDEYEVIGDDPVWCVKVTPNLRIR